MKILIAGDSFAAQWPNATSGWVNLLAEKYDVTNLAQPGIGEYKILKQIESAKLKDYDYVIVSHTSPSRIHTPQHPLHKSGFHKNCDLIATDLINRPAFFNNSLKTAQGWFKYHYDEIYQIDIYNLIRKEINRLLKNRNYISMSHVEIVTDLSIEKNNLDFSQLWLQERGKVNHYTDYGNQLIFQEVDKQLCTQ